MRHRSTPIAQWLIAASLGAIAATLITRSNVGDATAFAQNAPVAGARGVFAFTGQLDGEHQGLFMLDIEQGTIWVYEIESNGGTRKLKLTASRSWLYDRYLKNFNCLPPTYKDVQELVARERAQYSALRGESGIADESEMRPAGAKPTVDPSVSPN
ncbi:MAG: hypothetical protein SF069_17620 [Phycisphaerae bacterium]|nr:hypothetical protein [Phycisphaerae bacterium]